MAEGMLGPEQRLIHYAPDKDSGGDAAKPISERSFGAVFALEKRLETQKETASADRLPVIEAELAQATARKNQLVKEVEDEGGFLSIDQRLDSMRLMLRRGSSQLSDRIDEALSKAGELDVKARVEPSDPTSGVREWYFRKEIDGIMAELAEQPTVPDQPRQATSAEPQAGFTEAVGSMTKAVADFSTSIGELKTMMEQEGQLRPSLTPEQIAQMTADQMMAYSQQQTEQLRGVFGRMNPVAEQSRWVDVEYGQEFYTRFTPNMEPRFYTEITSGSERKIWDARWRLARATFFKKTYSGLAEKLVENQDLIDFSTEDMEVLYEKVPGVRFALEWYADVIKKGKAVELIDDGMTQGLVDAQGHPKTRNIWGVKFGTDFEEMRRTMRYHMMRDLGVTGVQRAAMEDEERVLLDTKLKSADAIAWNWLFCGNLLESIDSRYSYSGKRHGNLASEICSDDLRAVFHPQEKFEDKCWSRQEWGAFGKWGLQQVNRIKKASHADMGTEVSFVQARKRKDYWRWQPVQGNNVVEVSAPECYPIVSMKSFWEMYKFTDGGGQTMSYLEGLLRKETILWRQSDIPDAWKINYVTVRMRKANGLFEHFTKGEVKDGWGGRLKDYYTRLGMDGVLGGYYKEQEREEARQRAGTNLLTNEEKKVADERADRKAKIHFHNLKVWGVYAARGGVGRPQDRDVTDPFSTSIIGFFHDWNRTTEEHILRQPQHGSYLDNGFFKKEDLVIESIK